MTLNSNSLFLIITAAAFALSLLIDSRDNEVVQKAKWGNATLVCKVMCLFYHIVLVE